MSSATPTNFLVASDAEAIVAAGPGVVSAIIKLAANGLKWDGIVEYARSVVEGRPPTANLGVGAPRTVTIQAHSFLQDSRQWSDQYGIDEARIQQLRADYRSAPDACRQEIAAIVTARLTKSGSNRPVVVTSAGDPGSVPSSANPLVGSKSLTRTYAAEIRSNSGVYGSFHFETFDTGRDATQAYGVDLGHELFVLAPSKKLSHMVARIASLKGRHDPMVVPYVMYVASNGRCAVGGDIPEDAWECIRSPREPIVTSKRSPGTAPPPAPPHPASPPKSVRVARSSVSPSVVS